jgi:membrane-associated phospholipid phosphatase
MAVTGRLAPIDKLALGYAGMVGVGIAYLWVRGFANYFHWMIVAHLLLATLALLAPRAREAGGGRVGRFLADWYPLLLLPALYGAIGVINLDAGRAYDPLIQRLEALVFGSQVSYRWIREEPNVVLSWILHSCYLAYFFILYASPAGLWLSGRKDAARETIFAIIVTFFICYVVFIFFPVTGPRYVFELTQNPATEVAPARFAQWILDRGDAWGAAFPSSHVAGAVIATMFALRSWRRLGLILAPFTVGLVFSVVYGQFHYAVDAVAGLALAFAVYVTVRRAALRQPGFAATLAGRALEPAREG